MPLRTSSHCFGSKMVSEAISEHLNCKKFSGGGGGGVGGHTPRHSMVTHAIVIQT